MDCANCGKIDVDAGSCPECGAAMDKTLHEELLRIRKLIEKFSSGKSSGSKFLDGYRMQEEALIKRLKARESKPEDSAKTETALEPVTIHASPFGGNQHVPKPAPSYSTSKYDDSAIVVEGEDVACEAPGSTPPVESDANGFSILRYLIGLFILACIPALSVVLGVLLRTSKPAFWSVIATATIVPSATGGFMARRRIFPGGALASAGIIALMLSVVLAFYFATLDPAKISYSQAGLFAFGIATVLAVAVFALSQNRLFAAYAITGAALTLYSALLNTLSVTFSALTVFILSGALLFKPSNHARFGRIARIFFDSFETALALILGIIGISFLFNWLYVGQIVATGANTYYIIGISVFGFAWLAVAAGKTRRFEYMLGALIAPLIALGATLAAAGVGTNGYPKFFVVLAAVYFAVPAIGPREYTRFGRFGPAFIGAGLFVWSSDLLLVVYLAKFKMLSIGDGVVAGVFLCATALVAYLALERKDPACKGAV